MEASYGKEPFDLRLLLLRLGRNLWKILALTLLGTVLFGGGYYVKNVLLQPAPGYAASSTYKVEYVENPNAAGAYYINEATWNSLLHTGEFLDGVETHLQEAAERGDTSAAAVLEQGRDRWIKALSAALPSDFSIPVTKAATQDPRGEHCAGPMRRRRPCAGSSQRVCRRSRGSKYWITETLRRQWCRMCVRYGP